MHLQLSVTANAIEALLQDAATQLSVVAEQPRDEAEWLLSELLAVPRAALRHADLPAPVLLSRYAQWVQRRAAGEPFAYVTGTQPFRRLTFRVTPDVLIPRPDTEHLVEWALALIKAHPRAARVLDACTGSGCVVLALADEAPGHEYWASDCSTAALDVARDNAARLQHSLRFMAADALQLPEATPCFHLITANPPYIAAGDVHLPALHHEPTLALVSGADGLDLLRLLIAQAPQWLEPDGWLLLEHGHDQGAAVRDLLQVQGFTEVATRRDFGGNERVSGGRWDAARG